MPNDLISIERARELVLAECEPLGSELVALADALGRVIAEPVGAAEDVPGFANSAMDGFAVRAADTAGAPVSLRVTGESSAGHPAAGELGPGEAMRISTGAAVPAGADAVVRVEDTREAGGDVEIMVAVEPGRDIRGAGEDMRAGEAVLEPGTEFSPAALGVAASAARGSVKCTRRPRVAVLSTGDELLDPEEPMRPGGVRNSNAFAVPAQARLAGAITAEPARAGDTLADTVSALEKALANDVVVVCGGVSVGDHDHVRPALARLGTEESFWGVALRPGKPTWFGVHAGGPAAGGSLVFGLPGNPVSAMVTFTLFARPAVRALMGADPAAERTTAVLDAGYTKPAGRAHAVRCRLSLKPDGPHAALTRSAQGSHVLTSMLGADALALIPAESEGVAPGGRVEVELLRGVTI